MTNRFEGKRAIVTSGPTVEPLDPVRFISNRSSGKQGQAIAASLARAGAETIMISGPTGLAPPPGVKTIFVETAQEMLDACVNMLPADIAVCAAAVSDWRAADMAGQKLKKTGDGPPSIALAENPDILASLSTRNDSRPALVVGFAAETENIIEHARAKIAKKGCDWLLANDVGGDTGTFGGDNNRIRFLTRDGRTEDWPDMRKTDVANELVNRIAQHFAQSA